ncbi:prosaposin [Periophthalmus magnuspinnatus]|uniref:prosaposin n=1 Tax=Periophthalmus magnuspinnatus TaxID=409849 RepID=UPI00145AFC85|nr:prosaposin [Periophthalmus magnuspinnatus]
MLLLTLLFVSSAVATPLLGTEQCARGPPYWCQNVKTASLCGAVPHCQQNVWNKPQLKTVPCDLCKEVAIVVEQILKDNATEGEILGYLEKACQLIPDEGLTAQCKEIVDSYYPILIGIITGELSDPGVVCGAMGLCRSEEAALAEVQAKERLQSNEIPQVDLSQAVSPLLLNIPQLLYPQESPKKETSKQDNDLVCDDCIKFITDAQAAIKSNSSYVDSMIAKIEQQCDLLGPGLSDMCKQYISQYAPLVVEQLLSMDPKELCCDAGFCSSMKKSVPMLGLLPAMTKPAAKSIPAFKMVPATKVEGNKRMIRVRDSPTCAICEFVMKQLEAMLEDETTEEEVIQAVEKVCTMLPSSLTAQCQDLIETYGKAIIELLVQQADPKTVCTVLALCSGSSGKYIAAIDQTRFKVGGYCDVCKLAVNYIDGILEQNATEAQIEEAVKKVCNFLPDSFQDECNQLIEQYEPVLIQLLLQMMDPEFVCMKVGACPEAVKRLLGTEQCSWGPKFWCQSMETATRCNAVEHCRRHMW